MNSTPAGVACIVLAAGAGSRFGSDKRLAPLGEKFGGDTLLARTLGSIAPLFAERILVLGPSDTALASHYATTWQVLLATDAAKGMGHSLAAAIPCVGGCTAVVVALADMPLVQAATYRAVSAALRADNIVVPFYRGQRGNPVGLGRRYFAELAALKGDQGARGLLQRHAAEVLRLELDDPGIVRDVDTPAALAAIQGL